MWSQASRLRNLPFRQYRAINSLDSFTRASKKRIRWTSFLEFSRPTSKNWRRREPRLKSRNRQRRAREGRRSNNEAEAQFLVTHRRWDSKSAHSPAFRRCHSTINYCQRASASPLPPPLRALLLRLQSQAARSRRCPATCRTNGSGLPAGMESRVPCRQHPSPVTRAARACRGRPPPPPRTRARAASPPPRRSDASPPAPPPTRAPGPAGRPAPVSVSTGRSGARASGFAPPSAASGAPVAQRRRRAAASRPGPGPRRRRARPVPEGRPRPRPRRPAGESRRARVPRLVAGGQRRRAVTQITRVYGSDSAVALSGTGK
jgi:hypothetical protein